jgi:hypothetical protein
MGDCACCMLPACACSMRDRTYKLLVSYAHAPPTSSYLVTVHAVLVGLYLFETKKSGQPDQMSAEPEPAILIP